MNHYSKGFLKGRHCLPPLPASPLLVQIRVSLGVVPTRLKSMLICKISYLSNKIVTHCYGDEKAAETCIMPPIPYSDLEVALGTAPEVVATNSSEILPGYGTKNDTYASSTPFSTPEGQRLICGRNPRPSGSLLVLMDRLLQKAFVEKTCHINAIKICYQETRTQARKPESITSCRCDTSN